MHPTSPAQPPRAGAPDSPGPGIARHLSFSSTGELHGLREEEARGPDVPRSWPAAPPGSVPGNAASGGEKKPTAVSQEEEVKGKKPAAFVRVWSAADEVRILECLAAHVKAHGAPPGRAELRAILAGRVLDKEEFTVTEIYEKVRRLRGRYEKLRSAAGAPLPGGDGEELRKYELSKAIWDDLVPLAPPPPPKRAKKEGGSGAAADMRVRRGFEELRRLYPNLAVAVDRITTAEHGDMQGAVLKRAFELIDDDTAGELDAKVKKQRVLEVKTMLNRDDVQNEVRSALIRYVD